MDPFKISYQRVLCEAMKTESISEACAKIYQYRTEKSKTEKRISNFLQERLKEHFNVMNLPRHVQ